jgi:predicted DCC family thiol-disulfide oxidoreductase YuxK
MPHLTVLYDGECTKCTRFARWVERRDRTRGRVTCAPLQRAEAPLGLTRDDLMRELHAIDADGSVLAGWDAVVAIARRIPMLAWLVPMSRIPGVRRLGRALYTRTAARRRCVDCVDEPARTRR